MSAPFAGSSRYRSRIRASTPLVSFTFNLGEGALSASTLRRLVNAGRLAEAASQFERWVFAGARKLPGLVRRRAAERALWERGLGEHRS